MSLETRNGVALHVQRLGEKGSPVVMLHGLFVGSMASWYFTAAPALAGKHRVVLFDLRGHGKSERPATGYDVATMAEDLRAIAADFDEPVSVVGHSYGAVVALTFALRHPERVRDLVLVDAPLPPSRLSELESFVKKSPEEMLAALPPELAGPLAKPGRQARKLAETLHFMAKQTSLIADVRRAEDVPDAALATLACPTLCIYGTKSSCLPVGERIARVAPNASLQTIAGGHFLPLEAPSELARAIATFVDRDEARHG